MLVTKKLYLKIHSLAIFLASEHEVFDVFFDLDDLNGHVVVLGPLGHGRREVAKVSDRRCLTTPAEIFCHNLRQIIFRHPIVVVVILLSKLFKQSTLLVHVLSEHNFPLGNDLSSSHVYRVIGTV